MGKDFRLRVAATLNFTKIGGSIKTSCCFRNGMVLQTVPYFMILSRWENIWPCCFH